MKQINISEIIMDYSLYPRHNIDSQHAYYIAEAIKAGAIMPPIILDNKSKKVIDGFHRITAFKKLKINKIDSLLKKYSNEKEMFIDAMRLNSTHGRMLTKWDRKRCALISEELKIDNDIVAGVLQISIDTLTELKVTVAIEKEFTVNIGSNKINKSKGGYIPQRKVALKRTFNHKAGQELTREQIETNKKSSGMPLSFYANQIIRAIETNMVNLKNESEVISLKNLRKSLNVFSF